MDTMISTRTETALDRICRFDWVGLDQNGLTACAWAYYFFSVQFRENLTIAHTLHPSDVITALLAGECDTDNLSPWPGVAAPGERMHHDEFMRRALRLPVGITKDRVAVIKYFGERYLMAVQDESDLTRAASIASYEDGGLQRMFTAMLQGDDARWQTPLLRAFRHFLEKHIEFDSDPEEGHGALARSLPPNHRVEHLWQLLYKLFVASEPKLITIDSEK